MALAKSNKEVNSFAKGIVTEASPLNFPEGASFEEDNFVILRDGTRQRRQGIDYENNYALNNVGGMDDVDGYAVSSYKWDNAGGHENNNYLVVQVGPTLYFYDNQTSNPSANLVGTLTVSFFDEDEQERFEDEGDRTFSFTSVSGKLVVCNLHPPIDTPTVLMIVEDKGEGDFNIFESTLMIRDFFGVMDDLFVSSHPSNLSDAHKYNLLNQGWPEARLTQYYDEVGEWPSNAEIWHLGKYTNVSNGKSAFAVDQVRQFDFGNTPAPKGRAIINAFHRGEYRRNSTIVTDANAVDNAKYRDVTHTEKRYVPPYGQDDGYYVEETYTITVVDVADRLVTDFKEDKDINPWMQSVASFGGRVFYAGFRRNGVEERELSTPDYTSYVFYSRIIGKDKDFSICYQEQDPTAEEASDILDTDGGFINIMEANNIRHLETFNKYLLVFAENGIWAISGGETGFSATNIQVDKISSIGLYNPQSVVAIEEGVLFWSNSGIYMVSFDQSGFNLQVRNITEDTIQTMYEEIPSFGKINARGNYDRHSRKVHWLFNDDSSITVSHKYNRELILDLKLGAFYPNTFGEIEGNSPFVCGIDSSTDFSYLVREHNLVDSSDELITDSAGEQVVIAENTRGNSISSMKYLTLVPNEVEYFFTFSEYLNSSFLDWEEADGVGVDAPATLITGYFLEGDTQRKKGVKYLTVHHRRTETGFEDDGTGNYSAINPSSCKMRVRWDFANSRASNKYSREVETYRLTRPYFPSGSADDFDYGYEVVSTKNRIRGSGKALQVEFNTSPGKDLQLLGWGMSMTGETNV